tara:strand:- start:953 stop:1084 length:132 start_codon:yes stop_codon:yes gene_type:complete
MVRIMVKGKSYTNWKAPKGEYRKIYKNKLGKEYIFVKGKKKYL